MKYLLLSFLLSIGASAVAQDFRDFISSESGSHLILSETLGADETKISEKIEKFNAENKYENLRVGSVRTLHGGTAFIMVKKFADLPAAQVYCEKLKEKEVTGFYTALPISVYNFRVILSRERSFGEYSTFYEKNLGN